MSVFASAIFMSDWISDFNESFRGSNFGAKTYLENLWSSILDGDCIFRSAEVSYNRSSSKYCFVTRCISPFLIEPKEWPLWIHYKHESKINETFESSDYLYTTFRRNLTSRFQKNDLIRFMQRAFTTIASTNKKAA